MLNHQSEVGNGLSLERTQAVLNPHVIFHGWHGKVRTGCPGILYLVDGRSPSQNPLKDNRLGTTNFASFQNHRS